MRTTWIITARLWGTVIKVYFEFSAWLMSCLISMWRRTRRSWLNPPPGGDQDVLLLCVCMFFVCSAAVQHSDKCQQSGSLSFTLWRSVFVPHSCRSGCQTTGWLPVHYLSLEPYSSSGYGHQGRLLSRPPYSFNHLSTDRTHNGCWLLTRRGWTT